ncbi:MAG: LD-carboxypeptidase [Planctomycetota bacterium]
MKVTIVAPCGNVNLTRLNAGVARLQQLGFDVDVHPQCFAKGKYSAGPAALRLQALLEAVGDVVWCARGGYGSAKMLPLMEGVQPTGRKTFVGYSDATALHPFLAHRWGWRTIHGPMPAAAQTLPDEDWQATAEVVRGGRPAPVQLTWLTDPPTQAITGPLVGGNLTVWNTLTGTPWQPSADGAMLLLEDIREDGYAIDRMMTQLRQAGGLSGVRAIVLGSFTRGPDADELAKLFGDLGVPVALGHEASHGRRCPPVVLNVEHTLGVDGVLE